MQSRAAAAAVVWALTALLAAASALERRAEPQLSSILLSTVALAPTPGWVWQQQQPAVLRRTNPRALQQYTGAQVPRCEVDLTYRVVDVEAKNFTSVLTITNNRDLDMPHWQVVWRYSDYRYVGLAQSEGGIIISPGSKGGAPVRLVDDFSSDGIPPDAGRYSFLAMARLLPEGPGNESLAIQDLNINGLQCGQVEPEEWQNEEGFMRYDDCLAEVGGSADEDDSLALVGSGSSGMSGPAAASCRAVFCCGEAMAAPAPPPPPGSPPPRPADPGAFGRPPQPLPPGAESVPVAGGGPSSNATLSGSTEAPGGQGSSKGMGGALIGGLAAGGVLALAVGALAAALCARRRRQRRQRKLSSKQSGAGGFSMEMGSPRGKDGTLGELLSPGGGAPTLTLRHITSPSGVTVTIQPTISGAISDHLPKPDSPPGRVGAAASSDAGSEGRSPVAGGSLSLGQEVTLFEQLGSGAFGTVYRGSWAGHQVAVKVMQTACQSNSRELDSFRQEVSVLSTLAHPNIVCFLAACTAPPNVCIIEELAEGGSLHARIHGPPGQRRRAPLPYRALLQVAADVADAMAYLHPGVVHRDLKSQNVLLDGQGRAKVCDFGIAKFKDRTFVSTANGQAGTPAFMAPELFDGAPVSEKVDVFSYAILLWEMLTGEVPWSHVPSPMQIIYTVGVMGQRLPLPVACPPRLRALIEACWAEAPAARPAFPEILRVLREEEARVAAAGPEVGDLVMPPTSAEAGEGEEGASSAWGGATSTMFSSLRGVASGPPPGVVCHPLEGEDLPPMVSPFALQSQQPLPAPA